MVSSKLKTALLATALLMPPAALLAQQNDPNAPAQNASQLKSESEAAKMQGKEANKQKKAAKKESKVEDSQKKAAEANGQLNNPQ